MLGFQDGTSPRVRLERSAADRKWHVDVVHMGTPSACGRCGWGVSDGTFTIPGCGGCDELSRPPFPSRESRPGQRQEELATQLAKVKALQRKAHASPPSIGDRRSLEATRVAGGPQWVHLLASTGLAARLETPKEAAGWSTPGFYSAPAEKDFVTIARALSLRTPAHPLRVMTPGYTITLTPSAAASVRAAIRNSPNEGARTMLANAYA